MDDEIYEKYKRAGKIAAEARDYGASLIKTGVSFLHVANEIEAKIKKNGAGIAFPVNISINEIAAHYSPRIDDTLVFKKGDVIKLDVGSHIDGYIADTAITIELGTKNYTDMIKASSEALENVLLNIKADVDLSEVGKIVEDTITAYGFKPIDNLTGHGLQKYDLHSGLSVPNVRNTYSKLKPKQGDVLAIEPFATFSTGSGKIKDGPSSGIYMLINDKIPRTPLAREILEYIIESYNTLPFCSRWLVKEFGTKALLALRQLEQNKNLHQYKQLVETTGSVVAQSEHTILLTQEDEKIVTTK